ncbi:MAG: SDR family oxidoreductase [Pseudomonadales bacterium]|nr:SDR family oxidoreductase [Pseudomonadales bacterium]
MDIKWNFDRKSTADDVVDGRDLGDKIALVTGANSGMGFETARALASAGARVILACRNEITGRESVAQILRCAPEAKIELVKLDLGSLPSVALLCEALLQQDDIPRIDILICNAGSMSSRYMETEQGFELTVGVCHTGHFLLTKLLMPKLLASGAPRIVMLSSDSHKFPQKLDFGNLINPVKKNMLSALKAYSQAKLCNVLTAFEFQRRYGHLGLTACAVHPGNMVTTALARESLFGRIMFKIFSPLTKSPNQGAATAVMCAIHENSSDIASGYFSDCRPGISSSETRNSAVANRLWELSEHLIKPYNGKIEAM